MSIWIKIVFHFGVNIYGLVINIIKEGKKEDLGCE
jgi:hypothetical protein